MRSLLMLVLAAVPTVALATSTTFFGPIVPPCTEGGDGLCQACNLVQLADNLLKLFVSLGVMAAAIMFAYAGFLYTTAAANKQNLDSAKKIFWNVLIGLIFILAAFLIVDLILRTLTNQSFNVLTRVQCVQRETTAGSIGTTFTEVEDNPTQGPGGVTAPGGTPLPSSDVAMTHEDAKKALEDAGITVTSTTGAGGVSPDCSGAGCTNLTGMRKDTVDQLIAFKQACNCSVTVTGGTEQGIHDDSLTYSHAGGWKVDIDDSAGATAYIRRTFTSVSGSTTRYTDACGNVFYNHDGHWDIAVLKRCQY